LKNRRTANASYECIATPAAHPSGEIACNYRVNSYSVVYKTTYIAHPFTGVGALTVQQQTDRRSNVERPKVYIVVVVFASGILFRPFLAVEDGTNAARALCFTRTKSRHVRHSFGQLRAEAKEQSSNRGGPNMSIVFKFVVAAGFFFALVVLRSVAIYSAWSVALNDGIARRVQLSHIDLDSTRKVYRSYL